MKTELFESSPLLRSPEDMETFMKYLYIFVYMDNLSFRLTLNRVIHQKKNEIEAKRNTQKWIDVGKSEKR